jgi:hypothetical protein
MYTHIQTGSYTVYDTKEILFTQYSPAGALVPGAASYIEQYFKGCALQNMLY